MEINLIGSDNIETDIFEATSHLENQGYQVNHFRVSSHSTQGLFSCILHNSQNLGIMDG